MTMGSDVPLSKTTLVSFCLCDYGFCSEFKVGAQCLLNCIFLMASGAGIFLVFWIVSCSIHHISMSPCAT